LYGRRILENHEYRKLSSFLQNHASGMKKKQQDRVVKPGLVASNYFSSPADAPTAVSEPFQWTITPGASPLLD